MVFLILHVACGSVALLTAAMAFMTEKGPRFHAKVGRVYGGAMVGVGLTAVILWLLGATVFLLFIAFFSTYLVLSGWRMGRNRKGSVDGQDRALILFGSIGGLGLLAMSVSILITGEGPFGDGRGFAAVPLVFGLLSGGLAILQQLPHQRGNRPAREAENPNAHPLHGVGHHCDRDGLRGHGIGWRCVRLVDAHGRRNRPAHVEPARCPTGSIASAQTTV